MDIRHELRDIAEEAKALRLDFCELLRDYERMLSSASVAYINSLVAQAGENTYAMLESRKQATINLNDASDDTRAVAIRILADIWKQQDDVFVAKCKNLAISSSGPVQESAIDALSSLFSDSKNREISAIMSSLVKDVNVPLCMRETAYLALLEINGRMETTLDPTFDFPADVDWTLVDCFPK